jgi:hypothetical protein
MDHLAGIEDYEVATVLFGRAEARAESVLTLRQGTRVTAATAASNGDRPPPNFRMVWRRRDPSRQLFLVPNVKSACSDIAKREIVLAISPSTRVKYPSTGVGYSFRRRLGIAIALIRGDRGC